MNKTLDLFDAPIVLPEGSPVLLCNGLGVDSTAMMIALHRQGIRPDVITFADTGGEKPETYAHLDVMNEWCRKVGWPETVVVKKLTMPATGYDDLEGNNTKNETLPSLAFGMKSCSVKWKRGPQDQYVKGAKSGPNKRDPHPVWLDAKARGVKPVKLLGYDNGKADIRRAKNLAYEDADFHYRYPLQDLGWERKDCIKAIVEEGLPVPVKSACWFCPASQKWELWWLAGKHPDLFMKALAMEHKAMVGKHSRWGVDHDDCSYGEDWEELCREPAKRWPSTSVTVGLGRTFAWNRWARENEIVNAAGEMIASSEHCLSMAELERESGGNAMDTRSCGLGGIPITVETEPLKEAA